MKLLSKEQVLSAEDRQTEVVEVPEWGGSVMVQSLDAWQQSRYEQTLMSATADAKGKVHMTATMEGASVRLAAMAIVDEAGEPMFTEEELKRKSARAIKRVVEVARRLSGMDTKDGVEEAEGN